MVAEGNKKTSMPPKKPSTGPAKSKPVAKKPGTGAAKSKPANAATSKAAAPKKEEKKEILEGVTISIKQLNTVLGDEGGKIKASGRWPLVIDEAGISATFLRHRDCNFLEALDKGSMEAEKIRLAMLGSLRFGKPVVLDLSDLDLLQSVETFFDNVQPGLWNMVMDKSILEEDNIKKLLKDTDGEDYSNIWNYSDERKEKFGFWILTRKTEPEQRLMEQVYPVRIG